MVMFDLFRLQAQTQAQLLSSCVLALTRDPASAEQLDACVSAARSFKGAAHMVGLQAGADLARAMEECFAAARRGEIQLEQEQIGLMLQGVDLLDGMAKLPAQRADRSASNSAEAARGKSGPRRKRKRVLVIDDTLEDRELQRKLLSFRGYDVVTAVDGVDGWYAVLTGNFDLVLADVDMPLLDGVQLIRLIRKDPRFEVLPILIVCDNDGEQQRWCGFDAGADYYVIKGRFHDTLVAAVANLIGPAQP